MKSRKAAAATSSPRTGSAVQGAVRMQAFEEGVQRAVVDHLRWRHVPGLVWGHPANGGARSKSEAGRLKAMGVVAGLPDLLLWHGGKSYGLELKANAGRVSDEQRSMLQRLTLAGMYVAVAFEVDEAVGQLETWGLLR